MNITKIIIGIDDSKYAEHAAAYGFELARKVDAAVGLVNIIEPAIIAPTGGADTMTGIPSEATTMTDLELLNIQDDLTESILDRTVKKYADGLNVTQFSDYGFTSDGIIKCSHVFGADLIVIGTHSRTGIDRLLMGSVAEHIVRHSDIPVLVIPFVEVGG